MMADIHGFATYIYELRREPAPMKARAEARLELATESGFFTGRVLSEIYLGWSDALAGDLEDGIARMRLYMSELKAAGSEYISDRYSAFVGIALGRLGRFDEALGIVDQSFEFIERTGQQYYAAELRHLKGELLLAQNASNAAQAEQLFRDAIEIARKQHAKSWELRATTSLARLLMKQGKRDDAPLINLAYNIVFLLTGKAKAETLKTVLNVPYQPDKYPVQLIKPIDGKLYWFIDS